MDKWQLKLQRQTAAQRALSGINFLLTHSEISDETEASMEGAKLIELLRKNFKRLCGGNDGISRGELAMALMRLPEFSQDEYVMLQMMTRYFDTIINLSDDEQGDETKITELDVEVLSQFIKDGKMTLKQLHGWCSRGGGAPANEPIKPPPLTGGS